ncbi:hypothetical protein NY486_06310, partial [Enterobacter hormaechei]|nr:hypothetical protein [Enterobacter hormaechei]
RLELTRAGSFEMWVVVRYIGALPACFAPRSLSRLTEIPSGQPRQPFVSAPRRTRNEAHARGVTAAR